MESLQRVLAKEARSAHNLQGPLRDEGRGLRCSVLPGVNGGIGRFWAVTVRANWRVIFRFEDSHAVDVDYLDYH